ncbi:MAG: UbiD family decarboxylase, partial [Thermodesulfobacteriota bacterium]
MEAWTDAVGGLLRLSSKDRWKKGVEQFKSGEYRPGFTSYRWQEKEEDSKYKMSYYRDLRAYLNKLESIGRLHRIDKEVDKDWEVAAVARRVFQKIPESKRQALFFDQVKGYDTPIVGGILGGCKEIYAAALNTSVGEISSKWERALAHPIEPEVADTAPCKENILKGKDVDLTLLPVPVWTVGEDPGPFLTAPCVCTRARDTGITNIGTYRMEIKGKYKTGLRASPYQHINRHITQYEELNDPTPVAVVLGSDPSVPLVSISRIPYSMDNYEVAGGIRGEPLELVKCEIHDLHVPANAEIIIEGWIPPKVREHEGPFGEFTGYMGAAGNANILQVECITFRNRPILHTFFSQAPPSESSLIRGVGIESGIIKALRQHGIRVRDVHVKESGGSNAYLIISMKKEFEGQVRQAMWTAWSAVPDAGKITVVVDDDIDVRDSFSVDWAMSFRVQPQKDVTIVPDAPGMALDPSLASRD